MYIYNNNEVYFLLYDFKNNNVHRGFALDSLLGRGCCLYFNHDYRLKFLINFVRGIMVYLSNKLTLY